MRSRKINKLVAWNEWRALHAIAAAQAEFNFISATMFAKRMQYKDANRKTSDGSLFNARQCAAGRLNYLAKLGYVNVIPRHKVRIDVVKDHYQRRHLAAVKQFYQLTELGVHRLFYYETDDNLRPN